MTKKDPRGGARAGAGRKPIEQPRRMLSVRLSEETLDYLATVENKTDAIESAIRNSKGYRQWKAHQK